MSDPKKDLITNELNKDIFHNIFSYLIESDSNKALSSNNKSQYSTLLSVSSKWNHMMKDNIVWQPIITALFGKDYNSSTFYPVIRDFGKTIYIGKNKFIQSDKINTCKLRIEIIDRITGLPLYYCCGDIDMVSHNDNETRIGVLNKPSTQINVNPIITDNIINYFSEENRIELRIIALLNNKSALLYNTIGNIKLSPRAVGGYFNLPENTSFASGNSIYINKIRSYFVFDIIKKDDKYFIHTKLSDNDKYISSVAYLIYEKKDTIKSYLIDNLTWF
jgi:hypothetical protein